ncbi:MAG: epimerase [Deltaproteobacteria bacterium HGW-Deltaproteobacteria-1]|jgi:nucleoside-diphosphate-sugar epimerase|nr:MAG: epimerase [Deltaproteobacteria bacterium HGW-Deltaproteobacteria-1]
MGKKIVGVFGATSLVGQCLLSLLKKNGWKVRAFSRHKTNNTDLDIQWVQIPQSPDDLHAPAEEIVHIDFWICLASIWVLPDYFPMMERHGAMRIVALSSTSIFTKSRSTSAEEKSTSLKLSSAETRLEQWSSNKGVEWIVLRPTLIYGRGMDKNISEIVRMIRRLGFFPLLGQGNGLRQPVHAEDVALACLSALEKTDIVNRAYNLSGGETLRYREMINRLFTALGRRPRLIHVPLGFFSLAVAMLRLFPRYRHLTSQMAERMNTDLVFDYADAARDLNFQPRKFQPNSKDLPI